MSDVDLFARMVAHWPALGGDDVFAEARAHDWLTALRRASCATEAVEELIAGWSGFGVPHIADFQEVANRSAYHRSLDGPKELPAPPSRDAIGVALEEARARLAVLPDEPRGVQGVPRHVRKLSLKERVVATEARRKVEAKHVPTFDEVYEPADTAEAH